MRSQLTTAELLEEFEWTWSRHRGDVLVAAAIFECRPDTLARRLARARARGLAVKYTNTAKRQRRRG